MADFASIATGIELVLTGDPITIGSAKDKSSWTAGIAALETQAQAGEATSRFVGVDFGALSSASALLGQSFSTGVTVDATPDEDATTNVVYGGFTVTGDNGQEPYTYIVYGGALPYGIDIEPDSGDVGGTPTLAGVYSDIYLAAVDAFNNIAILAPFTITVVDA